MVERPPWASFATGPQESLEPNKMKMPSNKWSRMAENDPRRQFPKFQHAFLHLGILHCSGMKRCVTASLLSSPVIFSPDTGSPWNHRTEFRGPVLGPRASPPESPRNQPFRTPTNCHVTIKAARRSLSLPKAAEIFPIVERDMIRQLSGLRADSPSHRTTPS